MFDNATNDQIAAALRVLGYENPTLFTASMLAEPSKHGWFDNSIHRIPLDLASLLRRCRERMSPKARSRPTIVSFAWHASGLVECGVVIGGRAMANGIASDEPTALILALVAMGEKENGNDH